ncbi:GNAT family N-acetyltransferase [Candidatus Amarobacter glycogenicus]|uniref:GNAT family N-acetyltransferase n=1 Tax=Candidatus Amarobacter glycogenicus TaxID=3140699 RepID=UPI002A133DF8|nr:GNAT family N-acetyltransferase [Dehalococcoidia bacterium]
MPTIQVRPADRSDLPACAELLAARYRDHAKRLPAIEPSLLEASGCQPLIQYLLGNPRGDSRIAEIDGKLAGFLIGARMSLPPNDFASQFVPPQSISIPVEGHAVAAGIDALPVYVALYADLAATWAADGFFHHRAAIPAGDPELQDIWVTLGFGRFLTAATRRVADPVLLDRGRAITVERASAEDIEDVLALSDDLMAWHWNSPMFWPVLHVTAEAVREFNLNALRSSETPYFVAYEDGRPIAMQSFLRPGFTPPIIRQSSDVYLFEGIVTSGIRGGGIGGALLRHSMDWARLAGHETCTLHFAPANPSGAPFWLGHGFVPVEHTMERIIDSRIAWARPRS